MELKQKNVVMEAAMLLMVTAVISRILGFLRDILIYNQFGQNRITDAYNAAFSIPDFLYMLLVGGALSSAFIPVFSSYIATGRDNEGWEVASIVFNWVIVLLSIGIFLGFIYTDQLIYLLVPGFDPASMEITVNLTRIMFCQVFFMCFSGISMGILNSFKHFSSPALGSVLYNVGIILGGLFLSMPIEARYPGYGIAGFSVGVVIGAMLYFLVQVPALKRVGIRYYFSFDLKNPGVRQILLLMFPVLIGLSVSQINLFVNQNLASNLSEGMIAALRTGQRLMQLPVGIFAIAIAVAIFPTMTTNVAKDEIKEFKNTFSLGVRSVFFVTIPSAVGLLVLRVPLIRLIYEYRGGAFTHTATLATSEALLYYSIGLFAYGVIHVLSRTFYALKNTAVPVVAGILSIVVNIVFSIILVKPMAQGGLALAYSLAGIFNMLILFIMLRHKIGNIDGNKIMTSFIRIMVASSAMGAIAWSISYGWEKTIGTVGKFAQVGQITVAIVLAVAVYFFLTNLWHMEESAQVISIIKRRFSRKHKREVEASNGR